MDTRIRKVWKDLSERKARSLTTLAGLVIGLWGIGTVSIAWVVLSNDLGENFMRTLPPDLVVQTGPGVIPAHDTNPGYINLQLPGGVTTRTCIAGQVFDPGLAPSNQELVVYGYIMPETAKVWFPGGTPVSIVARTSPDRQQAAAREISPEPGLEGRYIVPQYRDSRRTAADTPRFNEYAALPCNGP